MEPKRIIQLRSSCDVGHYELRYFGGSDPEVRLEASWEETQNLVRFQTSESRNKHHKHGLPSCSAAAFVCFQNNSHIRHDRISDSDA